MGVLILMKKIIFSSPLKSRSFSLPEKFRKNIVFVVFMSILFAGISAGAVSGRYADQTLMENLDIIFLTNFKLRCTDGMLSAFVSSFASAFIFLLTIFLLGLSLWGEVITVVIPFVKGYGYGLAIGYLYTAYGFSGILYNILVILPGAFLCSAVIAAAAQESFRNSVKLISIFMRSAVNDDPRIQMKHYMLSMLWLLFLAALSSALDMLFSFAFSRFFHFP